MSGPKVLSAEEIRMRQEIEKNLRLVQERSRIVQEINRQISALKDTELLLLPLMQQKDVQQLTEQIQRLIAQNQAMMQLSAQNTFHYENNQQLQEEILRLSVQKEKSQSFLDETVSKAHLMREAYFDECVSQFEQPVEMTPEEKQLTDKVLNRRFISEQMIQNEINRLHLVMQHMEERASKIHFDMGTLLPEFHEAIHTIIGNGKREGIMVWEELHRLDMFRIQPRMRQLEKAERDFDQLDKALSEELAYYHTLCLQYGIEPRKFAFAAESIRDLQYASAEILEDQSRCLDPTLTMKRIRELLSSMGYVYLGDKEEDRQVWRQLFRIHDHTVLHIIYDSTGRVTMEVAIEDNCDRLPNAREIQSVVDDQGVFCKSFEAICQEMAGNGLHMKTEQLCPCGPEFAQIVNSSEFSMREAAQAMDYSMFDSYEKKYLEVK